MPSNSPGMPRHFARVSPGLPTTSLQSLTSFVFRHKRYVAYISGKQLNLLSSPTTLVRAITFQEELYAIAADGQTGKIAVAGRCDVYLLEPVTAGWSVTEWETALVLQGEDSGDLYSSLSWSNDGELLVGRDRQMSLYSTLPTSRTATPAASTLDGVATRKPLWTMKLLSPVQNVAFSPTASLIATCGPRDQLVKIWRRLSFEEALFDYAYLPHPGAVTHLVWRPFDQDRDERRTSGISGKHEDQPEVLYTIATDGILRIWRTSSPHDLDILLLLTTLDLVAAIPASPSLTKEGQEPQVKPTRYAFVLPAEPFCNAVTASVGLNLDGKVSHSSEHLKEISSKSPDIVVTLDGNGRMSAWGVQCVGHKRRPETPEIEQAYHIAHSEGLRLTIPATSNARFITWFEDAQFHLLVHSFTGIVQWWQGTVESFFSPSTPAPERLELVANWTGQSGDIVGLRSDLNLGLVSWDHKGEACIWTCESSSELCRATKIEFNQTVKDVVLLGSKKLFLTLVKDPLRVILANTQGKELSQAPVALAENCELFCSEPGDGENQNFVLLNSSGRGISCSVDVTNATFGLHHKFSLSDVESETVSLTGRPVIDSKNAGHFGVVRATTSGLLILDHILLDPMAKNAETFQVASFKTGVNDPSVLAVNNGFAIVASRHTKTLAIINLRDGYVEHHCTSNNKSIQHVELFSKHNLVAFGYENEIEIFMPTRYDYLEKKASWTLLAHVSLPETELSIRALAWWGDGCLSAAAGNGLFTTDNRLFAQDLDIEISEGIGLSPGHDASAPLQEVCSHVQSSLPLWHPSLLSFLFLQGHAKLAVGILRRLLEKLTFWSEGDPLHDLLNVPTEQIYGAEDMHKDAELDKDTVDGLTSLLGEKRLPGISRNVQHMLELVLNTIVFCYQHIGGLDNGALRYLFAWKLQLLTEASDLRRDAMRNGINSDQSPFIPNVEWREIAFAYHSTTQQPLLDILMAHYDNKITWNIAKCLGLTAWLNSEALGQVFDALAQSTYRRTNPPDPTNASLYFLAMHKKPTLLALWRIATWHKEQRATMKFLQRDFAQPENKTAAKKNAYALMGKRRFDYAAAFFLLADDPGSATSVLAGQCGEVMLSIAVARLYNGDSSQVLRKLLGDRLLPEAEKSGDRWLMSWGHAILGQKHQAADALVRPLDGLRTWQQDDPQTLPLYAVLRKTESDHECEAVLRAARILRRMGLWLPALELVRNWKFLPPTKTAMPEPNSNIIANGITQPSSLLDDYANPQSRAIPSMLDDVASPSPAAPQTRNVQPSVLDGFTSPSPAIDDKAAREAKAAELLAKIKAKKDAAAAAATAEAEKDKNKPPREPTQFKEPDANSLLDNFGF